MVETQSSLLRRVRDPEDSSSWREFVTLYQPLLLNYVRKGGVAGDDADEIVQEVLIQLVEKLQHFELDRSKGRFRSWLWRITRNTLMDFFRRRQREDRTRKQYREQIEWIESTDPDEPDAQWRRAHQRRVMVVAMQWVRQHSKPETWACFERHVLGQRPAKDVASELGRSVTSVFANSSRVLGRIKRKCADYDEDLYDG